MPDQHSENTQFIKQRHHVYFGIQIEHQDRSFATHTCCRTRVESLRHWSKGKMKSLPFGIPIVWRDGTDHVTEGYFCPTNLQCKLLFENGIDNYEPMLLLMYLRNVYYEISYNF